MLTLTVDTRGDAFAEDMAEHEVARILRQAAAQVESGSWTGTLRDYNGNTVGRFELTDETRGPRT